MASAAKLHILPSLALKLQSYNKNKFRSGICPGSPSRGARPRGAEQNPGRDIPGSISATSGTARPGRSSSGRTRGGSCLLRVPPPAAGAMRGGSGATRARQGAGDTRDTRPPFLCPPASAGTVSPPRGGGCVLPQPRQNERSCRRLGRGPDRHYSYGRAGPAGSLRPRSPAGRGSRRAGPAPSGRCRSWRREAQGAARPQGLPSNEAPVARSPKTRSAPRMPRERRQSPGSPPGSAGKGRGSSPPARRGPCTGAGDARDLPGGPGDL